jgi:GDP-L-fucose synthase
MKKRVLICGVSGFMGKNIFEYFKNNDEYEIFGIAKNQHIGLNFEIWGYRDLTLSSDVDLIFRSIKPDIVIQAAAVTSGAKYITQKPYIHVTDNVIMNSLLLRASYEYKVSQFIYLSCGVMYQPGNTPRKESDFNEHDEMFESYFGVGWMKVYVEKQMEFFSRLGVTKHMAIRHSNTYGPYDKFDSDGAHVLPATIKKVLESKGTISVWGNGTETARDLIYVSDVVRFIDLTIQKQIKPFDVVNVSLGKFITVKELVEKIVELSSKSIDIKYDTSQPAIPTKLCLDNTKADKVYGWHPEVSLEEGLKLTMEWYNQYKGK